MAHYLIFPPWSGWALTKKHSNKIKSLKIKYVNNVLQGKGRKKVSTRQNQMFFKITGRLRKEKFF